MLPLLEMSECEAWLPCDRFIYGGAPRRDWSYFLWRGDLYAIEDAKGPESIFDG